MEKSQEFEITGQHMLDSLNGSVYSQGIKIDARAWLDMGSNEWKATDDQTKAAAYQAAKVTGWSDDALADIMLDCYKHLSVFMMNFVLQELRQLATKYPVEVEQVYVPDATLTLSRGLSCPTLPAVDHSSE